MTDAHSPPTRRARAVAAKRQTIMQAALEVFSFYGFHGASLDNVAEIAAVSKTNLLYYFPSKEVLYLAVLEDLLDIWLAPLEAFSSQQHAVAALEQYIYLKLCLSRDHPQASRLFCLEMLQGAPRLTQTLDSRLKPLVAQKSAIIRGWVAEGQIAPVEPMHLLFTLWATTQHYADFGAQVTALSGQTLNNPDFFQQAYATVRQLILSGLCSSQGGLDSRG